MIAFLEGCVVGTGAGYALIGVGGVGYRLLMSARSIAALPAVGDQVLVHTHLHVREDEMTLFGFASTSEREAFEALLTVSGVGPKVALATLSALSPDELAHSVMTEDATLFSSVPGIGRKTAQRIIVDLGGRFLPGSSGDGAVKGRVALAASEAREALLGMGFTSAEVTTALKGASASSDVQGVLKYALARLGGGS